MVLRFDSLQLVPLASVNLINPNQTTRKSTMSQTVEQAQAALEAANAAYDDEMKRDSERGEGSKAQDDRRQITEKRLSASITQCERDLEEAKRR